jgi:hypothetical protein
MKDYKGSFYNQIPRALAVAPSTSRYRLQNTQLYVKIVHDSAGAFVIRDCIVGYKILV